MNKEDFIIEVEEAAIDCNCYTLTQYAKHLSDNFKKTSGASFTPHEVKEFVKRRKLPDKYGGAKLEYLRVKGTGIKFVRVTPKN